MLNRLIFYSLQYRVQVLLLAMIFAVIGAVAIPHLQIDLLPDLSRDSIIVLVDAPHLAAEEIELQVTRNIEAALRGVAFVQKVRSISGIGYAAIRAELGGQADAVQSRTAIQERLRQVQSRLPSNVSLSLAPIASVMGEIMLVGLTSDSSAENLMDARMVADWTIRPCIQAIPGIQQVTVWGGRIKQFQILADPERLRLYELSYENLAESLANCGKNTGAGFIGDGKREFSVRALGAVQSADDLERCLIAMRENHPVYLRDVAEVRVGFAPSRGCASVDGKPAIILAIQKMPGADTFHLTNEIDSALAKLSLPVGMKIRTDIFRQSSFIERATGNVVSAFRDGTILIVVVLMLFLADLRVTFASLVALPLSVLFTAFVFATFGMSLDSMSLGGIALACGELVDDAILDAGNIGRRLRQGGGSQSIADVVYSASSEIRGAIVFGTAAVLLACAPLMALPGLEGRMFRPLLLTYLLSIAMSFLVSLTVTPALASLLFARYPQPAIHSESVVLRTCKRLAQSCYAATFVRPGWVLAGIVLLGAFSTALLMGMKCEFLPPFKEGTLTVHILCHPGIALDESDRRAAFAEEIIRGIKGVKSTGRRTGRTEGDEHGEGVHSSEIDVQLENGVRTQNEIVTEMRQRLDVLPGAAIDISQPMTHRIDHLVAGVRAQVSIEIRGSELSTLSLLAPRVRRAIATIPGVVDIQQDEQVMTPRISFQIDRSAAALKGFEAGTLTGTIQTIVSGKQVAQISGKSGIFDVLLWTPEKYRRDAEVLGNVILVSPGGVQAPLKDVAAIQEGYGVNRIDRDDGTRICRVTCNLKARDLSASVRSIHDAIANEVTLPSRYSIEVGGEFEEWQLASHRMLALGLLAVVGIFAMLWVQFGSVLLALQIMLNVPFAFSGGVLALWLAGEPLSLAGIVGFISLAGVAIRNGVLMISHYSHLMDHEGMHFGREMVERGSQERVAPVLMTAACAGGALLPLILNPAQPGTEILYPVALVVVGGLVTCVLLDFVVTPTVYLNYSPRVPQASKTKEVECPVP